MPFKAKYDYDSNEFYEEILLLATQGLNDSAIAYGLAENFGVALNPDVFGKMKNGNYERWTKTQNNARSEHIGRVLSRGRTKINSLTDQSILKIGLGGKKVRSTSTTTRKLRVNGKTTDDEEVQTTVTESELPPNLQALMTWKYHHDPEFRKIARNKDEDASDIPTDIEKGVDIDSWIKEKIR